MPCYGGPVNTGFFGGGNLILFLLLIILVGDCLCLGPGVGGY